MALTKTDEGVREVLRRVHATAARQDWAVTLSQLGPAGADRNTVRRMVRSGRWVPLTRGSYWVGQDEGGPSLRSRVRGALLTCGPHVVAAGPTAARLLGMQGLPRDDGTLHLAAPMGHEIRSRPDIRVRRRSLTHWASRDPDGCDAGVTQGASGWTGRHNGRGQAVKPPSTWREVPVVYWASGLARWAMVAAISCGSA